MANTQSPSFHPDYPALHAADLLAKYTRARFLYLQGQSPNGDPVFPPAEIPIEFLMAADRLAKILVQASRNRVVIADFDPMRESTAVVQEAKRFNGIRVTNGGSEDTGDMAEISTPALFVNSRGYIIAWYLPGALTQIHQTAVWNSFSKIKNLLAASVKPAATNANWRVKHSLFNLSADVKGCINVAPAWFQQGHNMRVSSMAASKSLDPRAGGESTMDWLSSLTGISALMSSMLNVMHPEMYALGMQAARALCDTLETGNESRTAKALSVWPSVYSSLSAMVNRESPFHLDKNGLPQWLDLLLTVGEYTDLHIAFPRLSKRLHYPPGSVVSFSGKLLVHGVGKANGNRACIAWYMQDKVHDALNIHRCNYPHVINIDGVAEQDNGRIVPPMEI